MIQAMRSTLEGFPNSKLLFFVPLTQTINFPASGEPTLPSQSYFNATPQVPQDIKCPTTPPGLNISSGTTTRKQPPTSTPNGIGMRKSPSMPDLDLKSNRPATTAAAPVIQKGSVNPISPKSTKEDLPVPNRSTSAKPALVKSVSMGAMQADRSIPNATSLEEISGQIYNLTKYQAGCRFIQNKLDGNPKPEHVALVFNEIYQHLVELMTDPYGQYLIPQLVKYCNHKQRTLIVDSIAPRVHIFACHNYGIHGIQKVVGNLSHEQVVPIISSISDKIPYLAKDSKGNYLLETFLKTFSPDLNQFIYDRVIENIEEVSNNKVGCTIVNKCIDYASVRQLEALLQAITEKSLELVQDQFGNYVVQHIFKKHPSYSSVLIASLSGYIAELSVHKYSSNVIEKCLQVANMETYEMIIDELTNGDIGMILQDRYANFVIQTALDVANEEQHTRLVKLIVPYIHIIKTPYVIHIQKKILQI
eukprot:gene12019-14053_t